VSYQSHVDLLWAGLTCQWSLSDNPRDRDGGGRRRGSRDHSQHVASLWGAGFPNALIVNQRPKFTSTLFRVFVKGIGSSLIVG
jgi:hypothetical protein